MSLTLLGVLPVSAFNVGLALGPTSIGVEIAKLQYDLGNFQGALSAQLQFTPANLPTLPLLQAEMALYLAALEGMLNPANFVTAGVEVNGSLTADYAIISGQLALAEQLNATFSAGLDAGGLAMWTYRGSADGFGPSLQAQTVYGYGSVAPSTHVNALVVTTEDFTNWGTFSATFNTGTTADRPVQTSTERALKFEGYFDGGQLNTGVAELKGQLDLVLADLRGKKGGLEVQLQVSLGLNLPDFSQLVSIATSFSLPDLMPNLTFSVDLTADISALSADIAALQAQIGALQTTLSAGGFAVWSYSGPVNALGSELTSALSAGVPSGSGPATAAYGLVVACEVPAVWQSFGLIFGGG